MFGPGFGALAHRKMLTEVAAFYRNGSVMGARERGSPGLTARLVELMIPSSRERPYLHI